MKLMRIPITWHLIPLRLNISASISALRNGRISGIRSRPSIKRRSSATDAEQLLHPPMRTPQSAAVSDGRGQRRKADHHRPLKPEEPGGS
jgi:hypothetical protein